MAKKLYEESDIQDIANAIRSKGNSAERYKVSEMAAAINAITAGVVAPTNNQLIDGYVSRTLSGDYTANDTMTYIGPGAFWGCSLLSSFYGLNVATISDYAFRACTNLSSILLTSVTRIGSRAFDSCVNLKDTMGGDENKILFPIVALVEDYAFYGCTSLTRLDFGNTLTTIENWAFGNCSALNTLILRSNSVVTLGNGALSGTAIAKGTGYIYVPSALVNNYKNANNWSDYSSMIRAIEDYPSVTAL